MNDLNKELEGQEAVEPHNETEPEAYDNSVEEVATTGYAAVTHAAVTPVIGGRYKVSRAGMGGRKAKYGVELLTELLELQKAGTSLLAECQRRGLPYVSINSAMKRVGLK